jgi:AcrR family transcriptional regulator
VAVADLLAGRRPHRADAARNFDAIVTGARAAFAENGSAATLEDIARRAGVGIATLYRNFPRRDDLAEAAYLAEVEALCRYGEQLGAEEPWDALEAWIRRFVTYLAAKHVLLDALVREEGKLTIGSDALYASGGAFVRRAQDARVMRTDMSIDDVMRFVIGVTGAPFASDRQRDQILAVAIDALRAQPNVTESLSAAGPPPN